MRDEAFGRCALPGKRHATTLENYAVHRMGLAMDRMELSDCPAKKKPIGPMGDRVGDGLAQGEILGLRAS